MSQVVSVAPYHARQVCLLQPRAVKHQRAGAMNQLPRKSHAPGSSAAVGRDDVYAAHLSVASGLKCVSVTIDGLSVARVKPATASTFMVLRVGLLDCTLHMADHTVSLRSRHVRGLQDSRNPFRESDGAGGGVDLLL